MEKVREQLKVAKEKAVLCGAVLRNSNQHSDDLSELASLAKTAGAVVVDRFQQKIREINSSTYIGKGKVELLRERVIKYQANVVIFDNDLSPGQIRALEKILEVKVLDRSELILDIFATRAKTKQAKLQVELAQLEYTYPRLTRMWSHLDTVTGAGGAGGAGAVGGIGTRGTGEKQLEIDRRLVNKRITELKRELAKIDKRKMREIGGRHGRIKVCLVGYTNAGKSTLMNALTDAEVFVEDRLFATLDTRTRKWVLEGGLEVLLSDTVGFVKNLPHHLVASFKATLEEAVHADLLLHVVDTSDDEVHKHLQSVNEVLKQIGCGDKPVIMVLNKADVISNTSNFEMLNSIYPDAVCVSAKSGLNLDQLRDKVLQFHKGNEVSVKVRGPHADGKIHSYMHANSVIIDENYGEKQYEIKARIGKNQLVGLKKLNPSNIEILEAV